MKTEFKDSVLTAYLHGEIDHDAAVRMRRKIDTAIHEYVPRILCLDVSAVTFMDSSGIGLILGRYRQIKLIGGSLQVINIPDSIYRIFVMSGLERLGVLR